MGWSVSYNKRNYGVTWTGVIESEPVQLVPPQPVTDLETEPPGSLTWGAESKFLPLDPISYSYISDGASSGEDVDTETETEVFTPEWRETARTTTTVRIYNPEEVASIPNPEDRTQWVDVDRIDTITFEKPDGSNVKLVLDWGDA